MAEDILPVPGRSLDLTPSLRAGLKAITVLAFLSFFAASFLFCYLAYKLVWHFYIKPATTTISTSSRHRGDDDDDDDDQAKAPQNQERREQLAVMNRLQELARRQNDLNERLKELQTSLQEAKSEQERDEIKRRLKRLQEEQQQRHQDTDRG
jgi:hypothetical protein